MYPVHNKPWPNFEKSDMKSKSIDLLAVLGFAIVLGIGAAPCADLLGEDGFLSYAAGNGIVTTEECKVRRPRPSTFFSSSSFSTSSPLDNLPSPYLLVSSP